MEIRVYLQTRLDELKLKFATGEDKENEVVNKEEIVFLVNRINYLDSLENRIGKVSIGFGYTHGLPQFSSIKVSQNLEIEVNEADDFGLLQEHLLDVATKNVRTHIKKALKEGVK